MTDRLLLPDGSSRPLLDQMCLGRDASCDLVIDDASVSRRHGFIHLVSGTWFVEDLGSRNGTFVDQARVVAGARCRLRQGSRLGVASTVLVVELSSEADDDDRTSSIDLSGVAAAVSLSPYQLQVLRILAAPWLADGSEPASNDAIAQALGTPLAGNSVKAGLRRIYAKAGLSGAANRSKRRELCRVARERGWI